MSDIRLVKPVKVSTLHAKAQRYREGFVELFREYEGAPVITEEGESLTDGRGRVFVTPAWFAREMGVPPRTLLNWVKGTKAPTPAERDETATVAEIDDDLGAGPEVGTRPTCSCIPDPGCPIHGGGVNHGSPLENRYA